DDPAAAVEFVLRCHPQLPATPQLPNRSPLERRLPQAAWGIDGVSVQPDGSLDIVHRDLDPEAPFSDPDFGGAPFLTLRTFLAAIADRQGPAKFQLTGPVTLGVALTSAGVPAEVAFALSGTVMRSRARALLDLLAVRAPGVAPVVFVDEPSLLACLEPDFPIHVEDALDLVSTVLATLESGAITALRCSPRGGMTNTVDWPLVLQTGPAVLAVPVRTQASLVAASSSIAEFLDNGGRLAWGAVPTEGPVGSSAGLLWRQLSSVWCELVQGGCDVSRLRLQALVTPSGGLGRHSVEQAEVVLGLVDDLARRLYDQATGLRLSVGA
ncbi:MAG: hypothetical protein AB7W59_13850, partial [Acidimicrobiia bacterium]